MLQLSLPAQLFRHQTIYHLNENVDKKLTAESFPRLVVVLPRALNELQPELKEMMEKLIAACKIQSSEVVYLDSSSTNCSFLSIQKGYKPGSIIFFVDATISRNMAPMKKNIPYHLDGINVLMASSPDYLFKNKAEKGLLWEGLQKMFSI